MEYTLVRSRRENVQLVVNGDGELTVRAPLRFSLRDIEAILEENRAWIERSLASLPPREPPFSLRESAILPLWGEPLAIKWAEVAAPTREGDRLRLPASWATAENIEPLLRWLSDELLRVTRERLPRWSAAMGVHARTLRVSRAKARWGSMNTSGDLRLNVSLTLCPLEMLDFVIVHELAHIAHPNHSAAFWACVERALPDYRARHEWFKTHGALIRALPR